MRLFAASLLVHIFLASFTPGGVAELLQARALPEHYARHAANDPDLGVGAFLLMHYLDPVHEASDREAHDELPFQHHGKVLVQSALPERAQQWTAKWTGVPGLRASEIRATCLVGDAGGLDRPPQA